MRRLELIDTAHIEKLYTLIFPGKKGELWDQLSEVPLTTGELAKIVNSPSKNVSSQLKEMSKTGLVKLNKKGRLISWFTLDKY